jgi:hypothetical protein
MQCAAAPIRDVSGQLAGVLDLTAEARRFGFDAASMVALYATTIENRLLQAQSRDHLILRFQASPTLLGTPLEALAGIAPDGTIAWLNNAGARLLGRLPEAADERDVECLLGHDMASLLRLGRREAAQPLAAGERPGRVGAGAPEEPGRRGLSACGGDAGGGGRRCRDQCTRRAGDAIEGDVIAASATAVTAASLRRTLKRCANTAAS